MPGKGGDTASNLGLLALRIGTSSLLIYLHGWSKLVHFAQKSHTFPDPLHVGSTMSLAMVVFAEVVCAAAVLVGLATRFAVIPILISFGVIIFIVSGAKPVGDRELEILFATAYIAIGLLGPGRFSIDGASGR